MISRSDRLTMVTAAGATIQRDPAVRPPWFGLTEATSKAGACAPARAATRATSSSAARQARTSAALDDDARDQQPVDAQTQLAEVTGLAARPIDDDAVLPRGRAHRLGQLRADLRQQGGDAARRVDPLEPPAG